MSISPRRRVSTAAGACLDEKPTHIESKQFFILSWLISLFGGPCVRRSVECGRTMDDGLPSLSPTNMADYILNPQWQRMRTGRTREPFPSRLEFASGVQNFQNLVSFAFGIAKRHIGEADDREMFGRETRHISR